MKNLVITVAAVFAMCGPAKAQMVRAQDPSSIVRSLQGAGYKAELTKDKDGDPLIKSSSSGRNFVIFFYGCKKHIDCRTIQFVAGYEDAKAPTLSAINDWNANKLFARSYVSSSGRSRLAMDLDLDDGGLGTKLFEDNLEFWVLQMAEFEKYVAN